MRVNYAVASDSKANLPSVRKQALFGNFDLRHAQSADRFWAHFYIMDTKDRIEIHIRTVLLTLQKLSHIQGFDWKEN